MTLVSNFPLGWSAEEAELRGVWTKRRRRRQFIALLVFLDVAALFAAFYLAAVFYEVVDKHHWIIMALAIMPVYLGFAGRSQAYSGSILRKQRLGVSRSFMSLIQSVGIVTLVAFLLKIGEAFSRVNFAVGCLLAFVLLAMTRIILVRYLQRILGVNPYCSVLVHDGHPPPSLAGYSIIEHADNWLAEGEDVPARYDRIGSLLLNADRVVVACSGDRRDRVVAILKSCNVLTEVLSSDIADLAPLSVARTNGVPTLVVARGSLALFDEFVKRCFDITVSVLAIVCTLPIMLVTVVAIKVTSPGPVLFIQERIGRDNRTFRVFKFRSMRVEMSDAHASRLVTRDDDRVTAVGRFIRKTSIDELPQLFNVLAGTMSIVGPRPHARGAKAAAKLYWEVDSSYWFRHCVKPGLTGLAQVRGYRGNTFSETDLSNRLQADLEYVHGWSLLRDITILLRTAQVVISKGAF
ncbi:exopolysaccharide biosynthesis polyprenyl glycosylphosphotransferase [Novosphingobium sp. AP12]|uniref:exopolysaccharide biosynthesis polyprenyl glycosylphosphotransferase n=1 Tax=Novosphingobium sp. AP12 TaxID=1144305 RepID=UPI0002720FF6|nr:exopolysaccharide biosynthesis polyprenyl glycosylphosphotransferase [Novosphingobium sp. AP12]EJL28318.1 exopolysaccharide biosynthesis polyprenyl glycosylphosphotransferase [Novosphingobium sp. AP12]